MDSSKRQKPQRAPGKATVDRLFLLDLSDNRVVSLVASKGGTTTSGAVRPRPHSVVEQSTVFHVSHQ